MNRCSLTILFLITIALNCSFAQTPLDSSFGTNGVVLTDIGTDEDEEAYAIAIQTDGKIVVVGDNGGFAPENIFVVRYNSNGSLDNSFGIGGKVTTKIGGFYANGATGVALQDDGKIVVAGYVYYKISIFTSISQALLLRYNSNGTIDSSFSEDGIVTTMARGSDAANGLVIQPDGKIIVAGSLLTRYNTDGSLDKSFRSDGKMILDIGANAVCLQPDGKIITAGSNGYFAVCRFLSNGEVDSSFGGTGFVTTNVYYKSSSAYSVALQPDGKIVAGGAAYRAGYNHFGLVRYNSDGSLDSGFGGNGRVMTSFGFDAYDDEIRSILIQPDGKIIAVGYEGQGGPRFALARYKKDGALDSTFGIDGQVSNSLRKWYTCRANASALQSDGKIVAVGYCDSENTIGGLFDEDIGVARYLTGLQLGTINFSLAINQVVIYPNPIEEEVTIEYSLSRTENLNIQISDMEGRVLKTLVRNHTAQPGNHLQKLTLPENLAAGVYLITLQSTNGSYSIKVIKP